MNTKHRRDVTDQVDQLAVNRRRLIQGAAGLGLAATVPIAANTRTASAQSPVTVVYKTHEHPPAVAMNK
jgi:hypothetical protein